ncbi:MAG: M56 family metallopeptidase [Oscillospiraceae bacterium]|nr:M56 family metallopeptidase [Oscillospiraceae bacterium]
MDAIFKTVLEMSFQASWIILAVIAARFLLKSAPKWLRCSLWALVALRLLCPVALESTLSLVPDAKFSVKILSQAETVLPEEPTVSNKAYGEILSADGEVLVEKELQQARGEILSADGELLATKPLKKSPDAASESTLLPTFWLLGVVAMGGYAALSYLRLKKRIGPAMDLGNNTFACDYIDSPFILGIVRPKIYLPSDLDPESARYVLAHEKAHLKRRDHWWKPLGYCLLMIHWFNPLVWIAYILLCRDIELACDEKVIRQLGTVEKKAYSAALLRCSIPHRQILACPLAFGEVGVKQRVKSVLSYKKPGFWILLVSLLVVCGIAVGFLTDPETDTISDLYTGDREAVTCIDLWSDEGQCCLGTPTFLADAWELLDTVEYDPEQLLTGQHTETSYIHTVYFYCGEEYTTIGLSRDFTQVLPVWGIPQTSLVGTEYQYYPVRSPEKLEAFFKKHIATVYNREVTAEPFAELGQPYQWLQGLTEDALYEIRLGYSRSKTYSVGGYLAKPAFEELLPLLKAVPEEALINPDTVGGSSLDQITTYYSDHPNLAISFQDRANDLGVVVRYYEESDTTPHLELLMIDGAYTVSPDFRGYNRPGQKWDIDSPALLNWFREAAPLPPYGSLRYGHWMDYDEDRGYIVVSDGETTIKVRSFIGWTYETVEPTADSESFGVRVRHPEQTEGWIYISFWPGGYENTEINRYINHNGKGYTSLPLTVLCPNGTDSEGAPWSLSVDHHENGDYVLINEGADHWFKDYADEIRVQTTYVRLEAGERIQKDPPEMVIDVDYTQSDDCEEGFKQFNLATADPIYLSLKGWNLCGWAHDDTPEEENVLLTYWPQYETEGMVCVEYHEGFFQPPEGMTVEEDILQIDSYGGGHPAYRGTLPGEDHWTYFWIHRKNGSYVFRFENTEHWGQRKIEECLWTLHTIQFRG